MKYVNRTKLMKEVYNRYELSNKYSLRDVYSNHSYSKEKAWDYCKDLCNKFNGSCLKVIGANTFKFSAGFTYSQNGRDYFMYITDCYDKAMDITSMA